MKFRSLYNLIDLPHVPHPVSLAAVKQRLAEIAEGRAGSFDLDTAVMDTIVSVLADRTRKSLYDQVLEGLERGDGQLPRIKNPDRAEAIKQLCLELGIDFQEIRRGQFVVSIMLPWQDGDTRGIPVTRREFRGLLLEFTSRRYSVIADRRRLRVCVHSDTAESLSFIAVGHPLYSKVPVEGENGYVLMLGGIGFATGQPNVPIAFLSDLGNLAVCLNGAEMIFGGGSQAIAELFGVRDRPDRVATVVANFYRICAEAFCELGCETDVNAVESEFSRIAPIYHGKPLANKMAMLFRSILFSAR
ncbi:hypothetical protein NZK35_06265 [Stieleria sp. ICT_E10.1]|uniref:hypothetical protein n=1 Tax=Stieleria sedimenti TaxID=2976331 RepID=UPI00217F99AA|nr:hypothetical protein [Stieleria sedimenti]MCS7466278.1 hypothetical protein [Stieleria sedimenti]